MAEPLLKNLGEHWDFRHLEKVLVYNIDDTGREWLGTIRGKSSNNIIDSYIVELDEPINTNYPYDCISITEACLKSIDPNRRPMVRKEE